MNPKLEAFMLGIEKCENPSASVYNLLDTYYQCVIGEIDKMADDVNREKEPFPEELLQTIEKRRSGIGIALTRLLDDGYDIDGSDGYFNALMLAVGNADSPMVHYLLQHGADANSWPHMEESIPGERNYYLDDIDIQYMDECFANDKDIDYLKALQRTALVLVEDAHLGPYYGHSLTIDEEGNISLGPAKVLF